MDKKSMIKDDSSKDFIHLYGNKGITLIVLIITIVVIIILAGAILSNITGGNGIITNAELAKELYEEKSEKEQKMLGDLEAILEGNITQKDIKINTISKTIKGKKKSQLVGYEEYVGDFVKIGEKTLKALSLDYEGEYYVSLKTGEVYDISGEELNGIVYHTVEEYNQIVKSSDIEKTKELMQIKQKEIKEINNLQLDNGSFATYSKIDGRESTVVPYFDCIGMLGLLNDISSLANVRKYIQWHFDHINLIEDIDGYIGTIYDYKVGVDGTEQIDDDSLYDSVDSYAAMFFVLLENYYEKTGDITIFNNNKEKLEKVEKALNTMFNYNGSTVNLTLTKPQYPVYYLMDNCESYAGYNSLANIYAKIYNNSDKEQLYKNRANLIKQAIENTLWNKENSNDEFHNYDYAYLNSSYTGLLFDRKYYPYVLAQIYPVLYNIIDVNTEKAQHVYFLHKYYSDWSKDSEHFWYTFNHNDDKYPHFESLLVALMYTNTEFETRVNNYTIDVDYDIEQAISIIRSNYRTNNFDYYWNIAERGYMIRILNMYMNK